MFEWFELFSKKPGPVGDIDIRGSDPRRPRRRAVMANFAIASTIAIGALAAISHESDDFREAARRIVYTVGYVLVAFFIRPRPNLDNVGWVGGLLDHPFRFSDDLNRGLGCLFVVLLPGRYVAESIVQFFKWRSLRTLEGAADSSEEKSDDFPGGDA